MSDNDEQLNKQHHKKKTKLKKKLNKGENNENEGDKKFDGDEFDLEKEKSRNPKAFSFQSHVAAERKFRR